MTIPRFETITNFFLQMEVPGGSTDVSTTRQVAEMLVKAGATYFLAGSPFKHEKDTVYVQVYSRPYVEAMQEKVWDLKAKLKAVEA